MVKDEGVFSISFLAGSEKQKLVASLTTDSATMTVVNSECTR